MLEVVIKGEEYWDDKKEEFLYDKDITLYLEHSLVSISKWEAKYKKAFLSTPNKTSEEMIYYYKCMTITKNVKDDIYKRFSVNNIMEINEYINDPMTATVINDIGQSSSGVTDTQTSEVLYYQMLSNGIPMECQRWHLNRLITLIRVFNYKNNPPKKMSRGEINRRYREINEKRRRMNK